MRKHLGSVREVGRRVGFSAATVLGWIRGATPYDSTILKIANRTGISIDWLRNHTGDTGAELAKLNGARVTAPRTGEDGSGDWANSAVRHIIAHGDDADQRSLYDALELIQRRIDSRSRSRRVVKYEPGSE